MALRGCFGCLKFLVFVVNFLFWLCGLGVMAIGLWLLFDQQLYLQSIGADQTDYIVGTYVVLGVGMVMTLVGFLGCCGSWKESPWMLATFFVFLIIILVGEVAIGVMVYTQTESYEGFIRNFVETTVVKKYHSNSTAVTQSFDLLQEKLECCGSEDPMSWQRSAFNRNFDAGQVREIGIPKSSSSSVSGFMEDRFNIPQSCCKQPRTPECMSVVRQVDPEAMPYQQIHKQGCADKLIAFGEENAIYLLAVAGGVAVIQIIGMIFSMCLCCALKRIEDYKA